LQHRGSPWQQIGDYILALLPQFRAQMGRQRWEAAEDGEDTLAFSVLQNVRPMIETAPLEKAADAYARMMEGKARFRMVLVTSDKS
jgi:D-arabinose 1-dehydrogenase-like Zn-dependent alcohol dehydrogenase